MTMEDSMQVRREPEGSEVIRLHVTGEITLSTVPQLRNELLEVLQQTAPIRLDLTEVTSMDVSGLQLLVSARRSACRLGKSLSVAACSAMVEDAWRQAGLGEPAMLKTGQES
jgi:anti-anti-sigma factor